MRNQVLKDASLDDLNHDLIGEHCKILGLNVSSPPGIPRARGLVKQKGDNWDITVAAILLFSEIPTQCLPPALRRSWKA